MREQETWREHAAFMNSLVDDDFVILGGPIGDGARILLFVESENEAAIRSRLAADPWTAMGLLTIGTAERWEILLGDVARG